MLPSVWRPRTILRAVPAVNGSTWPLYATRPQPPEAVLPSSSQPWMPAHTAGRSLCTGREREEEKHDKSSFVQTGLFGFPKESLFGTVPNVLSFARILSTPVLCYGVISEHFLLTAGGFVAAGLLDAVDGYIARNYDQKTVYGGFLDPLADKVLVGSLTLALGYQGLWAPWLVGTLIGRDAIIIACVFGIRWYTREPGAEFFDLQGAKLDITPTLLSKVNTAATLALIAASLLHAGTGALSTMAIDVGSYVVGGSAVLSMLQYGTGVGVQMKK